LTQRRRCVFAFCPQALGGVYHLLGLLDMFEWFGSKDIAQLGEH
jgi:hypothetical protein